jgi:glycosyltransferase involved in cell wall biosynthesis
VKLMVVGHPFLLAYNQQKYVAMKRLDKNLRLRLIVPSRGRDRFDPTDYQIHPELTGEEVVPLQAHMAKSHMTYLYNPQRMSKCLQEFQPDVIHLDPGEPQALITLETMALRRIYARSAAVTLFTVDNLLRHRRFPLGLLKKRLRCHSLRYATGVICCNRRAAELLHDEGHFSGMCEVLPQYGLDTAEHQPGKEPTLRAQLGLGESVVVGYVGRMVAEKGLRLMFEALRCIPRCPWKLLLVGSGPLESEIRERWMAQLPGRIVFVPAVPYEQVARYLRCLDIFVMASYTTPTVSEQFGLALAQAMMLGIASIGSRCGAIPDTLGPAGTVVEQHDAEGLKRVLENWLTSPANRAGAGMASREYALQSYAVERVAARYLSVFENARSYRNSRHERTSETLELESLGR